MKHIAYSIVIATSLVGAPESWAAGKQPTAPEITTQSVIYASKLAAEEAILNASPDQVRYYVVINTFHNFDLNFRSYASQTESFKSKWLVDAYYVRAMDRAMLINRGDYDLVGIINDGYRPGGNLREACLKFERLYFDKFKSMPDMVPVDTNALIHRMLEAQTLR